LEALPLSRALGNVINLLDSVDQLTLVAVNQGDQLLRLACAALRMRMGASTRSTAITLHMI